VKKVLLIVIAALLVGGTVASAQSASEMQVLEQYIQMVKGDLTAKRDSAMSTLLELDKEESAKFWPLLKQYDKESKALRKKRRAMLEEFLGVYDKLTPAKAEELANVAFELDNERNALRKKYFKKISGEISAVVAVQFLQLQSQFETMGDMKLAAAMPLAVR
jgi:Spy/CpxP family protein refolding chaperone